MRKLLVIFAMLWSCVAIAQENHFMLQTKIGVASPMGSYNTDAYAMDGFGATVEAAYLFAGKKTTFGPMVSVGFFENNINTERAYDDGLTIISNEAYSNVYMGVGYMANLHFTKKFALTGQVLAGALHSTSPKMLVSTDGMESIVKDYSSIAFALRPAVGVKFYPGKRLILSADVETIFANQDFGQKQQVAVYNLNVGIGMRF